MSKKLWLDKKPETNKDWLVILCSCILFYLVLGALGSLLEFAGVLMSILSPFAGGVVLAYILDPFVRWMSGGVLHNNPRMRWLAILCAYLLLLLLIFLLSWLVVPQVGTSMGTLFTSLPGYVANVQKLLLELQEGYGVNLQGVVDALDDYEQLMTNLYNMVAGAAPEIMATLQTAASNLVAVFTAVASSIYMLSGKDKLLRQLRTAVHAALPRGMAESLLRICRTANENITGFYVLTDTCLNVQNRAGHRCFHVRAAGGGNCRRCGSRCGCNRCCRCRGNRSGRRDRCNRRCCGRYVCYNRIAFGYFNFVIHSV